MERRRISTENDKKEIEKAWIRTSILAIVSIAAILFKQTEPVSNKITNITIEVPNLVFAIETKEEVDSATVDMATETKDAGQDFKIALQKLKEAEKFFN